MNILRFYQPTTNLCFRFTLLCVLIFNLGHIPSAAAQGETIGLSSPTALTSTHCGSISSNQTWSSSGNVHVVTCNVTVASGVTLTIEAGTIIKFNNELSLIVNGKLVVSGTAVDPVYFTSYRDDTVGGDTNGNGSSFGARSDWEQILFNDSSDDSSIIDHAIIRFAGDAPPYGGPYGGIHLISASPTIQNTELTENHYCALSANLGSFPTLTNNNIHDNAANGFCLLGGVDILDPAATWDITDTSYFLRTDVNIAFNSSLTIQPGVVVKLDAEKRLIVNGKLTVAGTAADPVYFTSYRDDTVRGDTNGNGSSFGARSDWEHILFNDSSDDSSVIDHAVIRFAGDAPPYGGPYGGVHLLSASPTIQNTELTENHYCALSANLGSFPTLTNNNIHDNAANGFCLLGGVDILDPAATWDITSTTYFLRTDVNIALNRNLTINPGVVVKLDPEKRLIVNGKLTVAGTLADPVYFTSYRDDTVGGDTNGNGSSFGARSDWEHILFNDSSDDSSVIDYAVIRFAGDAPPYGGPYGGIHLLSASPKIQNTTITENQYAGLSANTSQPTLGCNNILNNSNYGIYNATPNTVITAENQWWGASNGPRHPTLNPNGTGNAVSDAVDFIPYSTSSCGSQLRLKSIGAQDGWVLETSETSNRGGTANPTATTFLLGDSANKQQYRSILSFNTASLPDNAVITKVVLKIRKQGLTGTNPFTTHGKIAVDARKGAFSNNAALQPADFQAAVSKPGVGFFANNPQAGGWYVTPLKAFAYPYYPYINRTGITQFRLRFQTDDDNDVVADFLRFYSGNAIAANRPVLVIEYYVP